MYLSRIPINLNLKCLFSFYFNFTNVQCFPFLRSIEENIFLPPIPCNFKPNILTPISFIKAVKIWGMINSHYPRYPDRLNFEPTLFSHLWSSRGRGCKLFAQIDAGFHFPYCPTLVDVCHYYGVVLTQHTSNTLRIWVGFRSQCYTCGWSYSLIFLCFYRL